MSTKLNLIAQKWSNQEKNVSLGKKAVRKKENPMSSTVGFLMGVQIPSMFKQIADKDAEIHQLRTNTSELSTNLSSAWKEVSALRKSVATKTKRIEHLDAMNLLPIESKIQHQSTTGENYYEIDALKEEKIKLNAELQSKNEALQNLAQMDDQWAKIAAEMAAIHEQ